MDPRCYDVFISHAGEQKTLAVDISNAVEYNGAGCFHSTLFLDETSLQAGEQAWATMESTAGSDQLTVGVILLSPDYVTKDWPMKELGILLQQREKRSNSTDPLYLIPVFAYTSADDCFEDDYIEKMLKLYPGRQQTGLANMSEWKHNLATLGQNCGVRRDTVPKGLDGLVAARVAEQIAAILRRKLGKLPMPLHAQDLESLVAPIYAECIGVVEDKIRTQNMVLIHGMGGSGKTTQAKHLFNDNDIRSRYCKMCYITVGQDPDIVNLQEELLDRLCGLRNVVIRDTETGLALLRDRLRGIKAFIVLDNVWSQEALDHLVVDMAPGSCVVITARRLDLRGNFRRKFAVQLLGEAGAFEMFCNFVGVTPQQAAEDTPQAAENTATMKEVAMLCDGLPLALKTTGSLINQKMTRHNSGGQSLKEACCHISKQLKDVGHLIGDDLMQKSLMISYKALKDDFNEDKAQVMFVNIAVFCKEKAVKQIVTWHCNVLYSNLDDTQDRLQLLIDLHLVEENRQKGLVAMHDQLTALAISLCTTHVTVGGVTAISSLFIRGEPKQEDVRELHLLCKRNHGGFEYLRNLCWDDLPQGQATRALQIIRKAPELQVVRFDNSTATVLDLRDPQHCGLLEELQLLSLQDCVVLSQLQLPSNMGELRVLDLSGCVALATLDALHLSSFHALACLDISGCISMKALPYDIGHVTTLYDLQVSNSGLESLPDSATQLVNLRHLRLACCRKIRQLPSDLLQCCTNLEELDLRASGLPNIPSDVKHLKKLKWLSFTDSHTAEYLPEEVGELECLEFLLINMNHGLRRLPSGLRNLKNLHYMNFSYCKILQLTDADKNAIRSLPHISQAFKDTLDDERRWRQPLDSEVWAETDEDPFYWRSVNRSGIMPLVKSLLSYRDLRPDTLAGLVGVLYLNVNTEDNRWEVVKAGGLLPLFNMLVKGLHAQYIEAALQNMSVTHSCQIFKFAMEYCLQAPASVTESFDSESCGCRVKPLLSVLQCGKAWAYSTGCGDAWRAIWKDFHDKSQELKSSPPVMCNGCGSAIR